MAAQTKNPIHTEQERESKHELLTALVFFLALVAPGTNWHKHPFEPNHTFTCMHAQCNLSSPTARARTAVPVAPTPTQALEKS